MAIRLQSVARREMRQHKFLTKDTDALQFGPQMEFKAGEEIKPHFHKYQTKEHLTILSGKVICSIYDEHGLRLATFPLSQGDDIFLEYGGHGFEIVEDTIMRELKTGPFRKDDKVYYDTNT